MPSKEPNAPLVAHSPALADMVERLAFAGCGAVRWPNQYTAEYHRAIVRRVINAMTLRDLDNLATAKRKP